MSSAARAGRPCMSEHRYVLVPGAGGAAGYWNRVVPLLEARGHEAVAVDLPADDPAAGLQAYADLVVEAAGDHPHVVVVAQSMGALSAPIACARRPVDLLVLVAPMVPRQGETGGQWWGAVGQHEAAAAVARAQGRDPDVFDEDALFWHDVPPDVVAAASADDRDEVGSFDDPFPLDAWPDVPTRVIACRDDRLLPLDLVRRYTWDRLRIHPDEMRGGHLPALAHPEELVDLLEWIRWQETRRSAGRRPGHRQGDGLGSAPTSKEAPA
jgi:pimeloyl-ACP methyl ester carboxylesterase